MILYTDHKIALMDLVEAKYVTKKTIMKREIYVLKHIFSF